MVRPCSPGSKKFAKRVKSCDGSIKCIKFGDKNMTIKKHLPSRKKSFCARHKCNLKNEPATPGYQSCKKWNCKVGSCRKLRKSPTKTRRSATKTRSSNSRRKSTTRMRTRKKRETRIRNPKSGRMVLKSGKLGKSILQKKIKN